MGGKQTEVEVYFDLLENEPLRWVTNTLFNRGPVGLDIPQLSSQPDPVGWLRQRIRTLKQIPRDPVMTALLEKVSQSEELGDYSTKGSGAIRAMLAEGARRDDAYRELVRFYATCPLPAATRNSGRP